MLSIPDDIAIILATIAAALAFWLVMKRLWPPERRRVHNDIIGWQVSVLGTTYAVILGFMLFAVWSSFEAAEVNAEQEANSLVNVFRLAQALPQPQRDQIQGLAINYAKAILTQEWPAMANGGFSEETHRITAQMWLVLESTEVHSQLEQTSLDHTMSEMANMTQYRRIRQLQCQTKLPWVLWVLLIAGAAITIGSCCLFGSENSTLHGTQIIGLTLLVVLALVAIGDINRPFQGSIHVSPRAFEHARQTFAHSPMLRPSLPRP